MKKFLLIFLCIWPFELFAINYYCITFKKTNGEIDYSKSYIEKYKFATKLELISSNVAFLSRCSFSPLEKRITCDRYLVDKIEKDFDANIMKFYVFRSQFNFQLFPDLTSLEDNGRGDISYQKCEIY